MSTNELKTAEIRPSKTNPRKSFDKDAMAELTTSVVAHGILQPVLVRPHPEGVGYELVAGERRFRAAITAKLERIPCFVKELTDVEVLEVQLIENLQRSDLHELEEAQGYRILMDDHGYTAKQIGEKVGKSARYVYARAQLTKLTPKAEKMFRGGELNASTALLVASIPNVAVADRAAAEIATEDPHDGKMSFRDAKDFVAQECMVRLKKSDFPDSDVLVEGTPTCAGCPKRTGNLPDLFEPKQDPDVCTDPGCHREKMTAHFNVQAALRETKGARRATDKEERSLTTVENYGRRKGRLKLRVTHASKLVPLTDQHPNHQAGRQTWKKLLGKAAPQSVVMQHPETGRLLELVERAEAEKVLAGKFKWAKKEAAAKKKAPSGVPAVNSRHKGELEDWEIDVGQHADRLAMGEVSLVVAAQGMAIQDEIMPLLVRGAFAKFLFTPESDDFLKRRGIERKKPKGAKFPRRFTEGEKEKELKKLMTGAKPADLLAMLTELLVHPGEAYRKDETEMVVWNAAKKATGADLNAETLRKRAEEALADSKPKPPAEKLPAKKKAKKKKAAKKAKGMKK